MVRWSQRRKRGEEEGRDGTEGKKKQKTKKNINASEKKIKKQTDDQPCVRVEKWRAVIGWNNVWESGVSGWENVRTCGIVCFWKHNCLCFWWFGATLLVSIWLEGTFNSTVLSFFYNSSIFISYTWAGYSRDLTDSPFKTLSFANCICKTSVRIMTGNDDWSLRWMDNTTYSNTKLKN